MKIKAHLPKIIILFLLAIILGVPFALRPTAKNNETKALGNSNSDNKLIIFTPNNAQIRHEFAHGFNKWRKSKNLPKVTFDWRASGGTSDLIKLILSALKAKAENGNENQGVGADLFFGGGAFNQDKLARGITVKREGKKVHISAIVAPDISLKQIKKIFPQSSLAGAPLYDSKLRWIGTALSSFGIVYNRDLLKMLNLKEPIVWTDLASPKYLHELALADPSHSGAIAETYDIIVRRLGWKKGWRVLKRIFANARSFSAGSSSVPVNVSQGQAAAGMSIDFYGRYQAGAIDDNRVGYIDPSGMTAVTADPISLLRGAPHKKIANQFIKWILSKPAQRLWQQKVGTPGGPEKFQLRRQPVRRDLYTKKDKQYWTDPKIDPFSDAKPLARGIPDYYLIIAPITRAMAIDLHSELTQAWAAIIHTPKHSLRRAKMLKIFYLMPDDLTIKWPDGKNKFWSKALKNENNPKHKRAVEIINEFWNNLINSYRGEEGHNKLLRDQSRWSKFFKAQYKKVLKLANRQ